MANWIILSPFLNENRISIDDSILFMMVVCHQPYSEILDMEYSKILRYQEIFMKWVTGFFDLFGKDKKDDKGEGDNVNSFTPELPQDIWDDK